MGFLNVISRSAVKGLKAMGQVAAVGGIMAVLADPEVIAGVATVAGPLSGAAVLAITFGLRTALDVIKHRDKVTLGVGM